MHKYDKDYTEVFFQRKIIPLDIRPLTAHLGVLTYRENNIKLISYVTYLNTPLGEYLTKGLPVTDTENWINPDIDWINYHKHGE